MNGTLSLVGSYTKKNQVGGTPAVVISKRPLDPKEPPMPPTTIPGLKKSVSLPQTSEVISPILERKGVAMDLNDSTSIASEQIPLLPSSADSKTAQEMWEYIRPHLSVHNEIPAKNWVRHVIHLPRVRELRWNEERIREWPYKDSHPRDITAMVVQLTGVESPVPCRQCVRGKGPFIGCIMISPEASPEAKSSVLSCANCECIALMCLRVNHC